MSLCTTVVKMIKRPFLCSGQHNFILMIIISNSCFEIRQFVTSPTECIYILVCFWQLTAMVSLIIILLHFVISVLFFRRGVRIWIIECYLDWLRAYVRNRGKTFEIIRQVGKYSKHLEQEKTLEEVSVVQSGCLGYIAKTGSKQRLGSLSDSSTRAHER